MLEVIKTALVGATASAAILLLTFAVVCFPPIMLGFALLVLFGIIYEVGGLVRDIMEGR